MSGARTWWLAVTLLMGVSPVPARAQIPVPTVASDQPAASDGGQGFRLPATCWRTAVASAKAVSPASHDPGERHSPALPLSFTPDDAPVDRADRPGGARGFLHDVRFDYRSFFSWETAEWLSAGGVAALAVHGADEAIREELQDPDATLTQALTLDGGAQYGNLTAQVPVAVAWWAIGHAMGSPRGSAAGRDLVRAQISALSWTYVLKYSVDRTRPNGDPRSFPSGHSSAAFATAMVLQEHYGWKVGVPVFAAAAYTAASRLTVNKHWASDVAFGAVVGMTCGRVVTVHVRRTQLTLLPQAVPGGGAVMFTTTRKRV